MKYAFPGQRTGSIHVLFRELPEELHLTVQDNGIGMDSAAKRSDSFGLGMVRSLMRKLKADINIVNGKGTSVELVIRDFRKVNFA
jgi:two-component sensor histidine kinase